MLYLIISVFLSFIQSTLIASFPPEFQFGIATAPAHVEDHLKDSWLEYGNEGKIPFFKDIPKAEERLRFWSQPEVERGWMKELGVNMVRLGLDWGRLMPFEPETNNCWASGYVHRTSSQDLETFGGKKFPCRNGIQDQEAMNHYKKMFQDFRKEGFFICLSLFHHSLPLWANDLAFYGWTNPKIVPFFLGFVKDVTIQVQHLIDQYTILNEPAVFASLVYAVGLWPGHKNEMNWFAYFNSPFVQGSVVKAYKNMAEAHRQAYYMIKELDQVKSDHYPKNKEPKWAQDKPALIGVAHNLGYYISPTIWSNLLTHFIHQKTNIEFMDMIAPYLDFIGVNYYGKEFVTLKGAAIYKNQEYSESGRSISPYGFYLVIRLMHNRYNIGFDRKLPIIITENGISDKEDVLRPAYLIEHLLVINKLREEGVPVEGYYFWTLSDNWEWADGYCPHFGLLDVDRADKNMKRTPRPSFYLLKEIIETKKVLHEQRFKAWQLIRKPPTKERSFCRGATGKETVTEPTFRKYAKVDWRFDYRLELFPRFWWWFRYRAEPVFSKRTREQHGFYQKEIEPVNIDKEIDILNKGYGNSLWNALID